MAGISFDDLYGDASDVSTEVLDAAVEAVGGIDAGDVPSGWEIAEGGAPDDVIPVSAVVAPVAPVPVYVAPVAPVSAVNAFGGILNGANVQVTKTEGKRDLTEAHMQWATRPADERFWTVQEMAAKCREYKESSRQVKVNLASCEIQADQGEMLLIGGGMRGPAKFTHYSFDQLCRSAGAPAGYLRDLDGELAAKCLTVGLRKRAENLSDSGNVLVRGNASQRCHAFLSDKYSRIWNADVVSRLGEVEANGWRVPPARPSGIDDPRARPATEADVLKHNKGGGGISVKVGDLIAPAGLYASDKDMFAFMVSEASFEVGGSLMNRGFFVSNSEVGDRSFSITTFLYDAVCGNHIVWGASEITEVRIVHRGRANTRWISDLQRSLAQYRSQGTTAEREMIMKAIGTQIGIGKEEVVKKLFEKGLTTKKNLEAAYDWAVRESRMRGNVFQATSVWGMVCGLTRVAQETGWADQRVQIDQAAGKLLRQIA